MAAGDCASWHSASWHTASVELMTFVEASSQTFASVVCCVLQMWRRYTVCAVCGGIGQQGKHLMRGLHESWLESVDHKASSKQQEAAYDPPLGSAKEHGQGNLHGSGMACEKGSALCHGLQAACLTCLLSSPAGEACSPGSLPSPQQHIRQYSVSCVAARRHRHFT